MRLRQSVMSDPRVVPSKYLENKPRDSKTPASIPILRGREIFPGKIRKRLWMRSLLRSPSRATTVIWEGTREFIYFIARNTRPSSVYARIGGGIITL